MKARIRSAVTVPAFDVSDAEETQDATWDDVVNGYLFTLGVAFDAGRPEGGELTLYFDDPADGARAVELLRSGLFIA